MDMFQQSNQGRFLDETDYSNEKYSVGHNARSLALTLEGLFTVRIYFFIPHQQSDITINLPNLRLHRID